MTLSPSFNGGALPDLDLAVYDTESLQDFHDTLEAAISLISQSPYARKIAQAAIDADYVVVIEDTPKGETPEEFRTRERGSVDHPQKIIFIRKENDVETLALTLFHELAHVSQRVTCGIEVSGLEDRPLTLLKKLLMMEADARAQELALAIELRSKYPTLLEKAAAKAESFAVDDLVLKINQCSITTEAAMMERYNIYFSTAPLRLAREEAVLSMLERLGRDQLQDPALFSKTVSDSDLVAAFATHGAPYLQNHDSDLASAVSTDNFDRFQRLWAIRAENPAIAHETPRLPPVYKVSLPKPKAPRP